MRNPGRWLWAWESLKKGNNPPGPDGRTIAALDQDPATVMRTLQDAIADGTYRPGACVIQPVRQATGKIREIAWLNIEDKWVHRVLQDILAEAAEPLLPPSACAYRKGSGPLEAALAIQRGLQAGYTHYAHTDIEHFFPSVDLDRLCGIVTTTLGNAIGDLTSRLLRPPFIDRQGQPLPVKGLPLGFPISPVLSNLYLLDLDLAMEKRGQVYVRFSDDIYLLGHEAAVLAAEIQFMETILHPIGLRLKRQKTRIASIRGGIDCLGHIVRKDRIYQKRTDKPVAVLPVPWEKEAPLPSEEAASPEDRALQAALGDISSLSQPQGKIGEEMITFEGATSLPTDLNRLGFRVFLRTLYVSDPSLVVRVANQNAVIQKDGQRESIPLRKIHQVINLGRVPMTTAFLVACLARKIPVVFLSHRGGYLGRLSAEVTLHSPLIRRQMERFDNLDFRLKTARVIIGGKIRAQMAFLQSRRNKNEGVPPLIRRMGECIPKLAGAPTVATLMGYEGHTSRLYFEALGSLFRGELTFTGRRKHPSTDPVNALLSFGYTLLYGDIQSILLAHGLDPGLGFLHESLPGRPNLAMDLIEELRAPVVDRLVLRTVNTGVFRRDHFQKPRTEGGPCYLEQDSRKRFIVEYEKAMAMEYRHKSTNLKVDVRRIISIQVVCLKKVLAGHLPLYIPAELE